MRGDRLDGGRDEKGLGITVTCAVSDDITFGPDGGVPVAVTTFVRLFVTLASRHS